MGYEAFGNFGRTPEEVIETAKKQKKIETAARAVLHPLSTIVSGTAKVAGGNGKPVDEELYIKAIIIKIMKDKGLHPHASLEDLIRKTVKQVMREESAGHPHWKHPTLKRK